MMVMAQHKTTFAQVASAEGQYQTLTVQGASRPAPVPVRQWHSEGGRRRQHKVALGRHVLQARLVHRVMGAVHKTAKVAGALAALTAVVHGRRWLHRTELEQHVRRQTLVRLARMRVHETAKAAGALAALTAVVHGQRLYLAVALGLRAPQLMRVRRVRTRARETAQAAGALAALTAVVHGRRRQHKVALGLRALQLTLVHRVMGAVHETAQAAGARVQATAKEHLLVYGLRQHRRVALERAAHQRTHVRLARTTALQTWTVLGRGAPAPQHVRLRTSELSLRPLPKVARVYLVVLLRRVNQVRVSAQQMRKSLISTVQDIGPLARACVKQL